MATPRIIGPKPIKWFAASWPGACAGCGDPFAAEDQVGYTDQDHLVAYDCCAGNGYHEDEELGTPVDRRPKVAIMPRGKTVRDRCPRCFIIHTAAQGDDCQ